MRPIRQIHPSIGHQIVLAGLPLALVDNQHGANTLSYVSMSSLRHCERE